MGLAEPRKRIKIAHDPRNLAWSTAQNSYGQRLMQQQGWKEGEALGAKNTRYSDTEASKLRLQYKDDTLGLGASLKSKDVAHQRTGFDAFQGLLGRLNAKSDEEVRVIEQKMEDKKLAAFAQGRWGGMVFVPGGVLVQNDTFKLKLELDRLKEEKKAVELEAQRSSVTTPTVDADDLDENARRKAEKKLRKEERRLRREAKRAGKTELGLPTPDISSANEADIASKAEKKEKKQKKKRSLSPEPESKSAPLSQEKLRNGRHILRGRNIMAKRAAFSDMKGLDEIFMRKP